MASSLQCSFAIPRASPGSHSRTPLSQRSSSALSFPGIRRRRGFPLRICAAEAGTEPIVKPPITLSPTALNHLNKMRADRNEELYLRIGVRQGGCSGMSYTMDFELKSNLKGEDTLIDYEGFTMVCDPKSLLYLYGMQLDYSDALIGGGFSFSNPNATSTCGCGKSFAA